MHRDRLTEIGPNRSGLLLELAPEIDDAMLVEISEADYGMDAAEHLSHLQRIRDQQDFSAPMAWCPREVLELIRWSEPDDPDWQPGSTGRRGHLMRAFSCAALLYAASMPENCDRFEGENQTLAQLLDSLRQMNHPRYTQTAAHLMAYRLVNSSEKDEERPFFILALLILSLRVHAADPLLSDSLIAELATWLIEDEHRVRTAPWAVLPEANGRWLLGLTYYDMRHDKWIAMGDELQDLAANLNDEAARRLVTDIAIRR